MAEYTEGFKLQIPDPTPVELPLRYAHQQTADEKIAAAVSHELSFRSEQHGMETLEQANDFDIEDPDEWDPTSPYEITEMHEDYLDDPRELTEEKTDVENTRKTEDTPEPEPETQQTQLSTKATPTTE